MMLQEGVRADASMSPCGSYRYALTRDWFPKDRGHVLWVMLNPSTATAEEDDPTIRRCQTFARAWGYDGITVANIFALRATDPKELYSHREPIGAANDDVLTSLLDAPAIGLAVAAWGTHGRYRNRGYTVRLLAKKRGRRLHVLGLTKGGYPRHPLYVRADVAPEMWAP